MVAMHEGSYSTYIMARAVSIHMLTSKDRARWHFLDENATRHRGFCEEQNRNRCRRSHTLYIGVTGGLHKRVFEHKWKEHDGFASKCNCDRLVWFENYQDATKAIGREKQLKGWARKKKIGLIEKTNPAWGDLSKDWYDVEPADLKRATDRMLA
jgi:putative endonuclease